jgi:putative peptidoglycan lipid II flippase
MIAVGAGLGLSVLPKNSIQPIIGSLNAESVGKLIQVMLYMAGLVPCVALINALTNGYYAKGDTRTPTRVGMIAFTIGVGMKFAGFYAGGLMGLAVAVSVYAVVYCIVLYVTLERQVNRLLAAKPLVTEFGAETVMQGVDVNASIS